jgi:hypothetical protein
MKLDSSLSAYYRVRLSFLFDDGRRTKTLREKGLGQNMEFNLILVGLAGVNAAALLLFLPPLVKPSRKKLV